MIRCNEIKRQKLIECQDNEIIADASVIVNSMKSCWGDANPLLLWSRDIESIVIFRERDVLFNFKPINIIY